MSTHQLYTFDRADAALTLLPMAARRALDVAGVHLSLAAWQRAPLALRRTLVALGACERVPVAEVGRCLEALAASGDTRAVAAIVEPEPTTPPPDSLLAALGPGRPLAPVRWSNARALDRYVLLQLAQRGKLERLAEAYDEIFGSR